MSINNSEIIDRVIELKNMKKGPDYISKQLTKELQRDVPIETIKEILQQVKEAKKNGISLGEDISKTIAKTTKELEKEDGGLKKMVDSIEQSRPYEFDYRTDHYMFKIGGKTHPIIRTTILAMFEKFSSKGENLTELEMIAEFKLTADVWAHIKKAVGLYKKSGLYDPVSITLLPDVENMDKEIYDKALILKEAELRRMLDKQFINVQVNKLKQFEKGNKKQNDFLESLERVIKVRTPLEQYPLQKPKEVNNLTKEVAMTDFHIGKTGTKEIIERFSKLGDDLANCKETNINIYSLGDLGEQFLPYLSEKHPGMRLGMEDTPIEDNIILILDTFEMFLNKVYSSGKVIKFYGIPGNHDVLTINKDFDPQRSAGLIIYSLLKRVVEKQHLEVNIMREKYNVIKSQGVKYVFTHGDGLNEGTVKNLALQYQDEDYLIIVSGDKHHMKMKEITDNIMWVQVPAMAGKGKYDSDLVLSSQPGVVFFDKNAEDMVDITVKRYK